MMGAPLPGYTRLSHDGLKSETMSQNKSFLLSCFVKYFVTVARKVINTPSHSESSLPVPPLPGPKPSVSHLSLHHSNVPGKTLIYFPFFFPPWIVWFVKSQPKLPITPCHSN
jgi:hypothetical protein